MADVVCFLIALRKKKVSGTYTLSIKIESVNWKQTSQNIFYPSFLSLLKVLLPFLSPLKPLKGISCLPSSCKYEPAICSVLQLNYI